MVKDIRIEDFDYALPDERIARHPLQKRDECKLLLVRPDGKTGHFRFKNLPDLLPVGSLLVCNDTKVINARIEFRKETGARIEIFLLEPYSPSDYAEIFRTSQKCIWKCLVGNLKKWKEGPLKLSLNLPGSPFPVILIASKCDMAERGDNDTLVEFSWDNPDISFAEILEFAGKIPIPPYLNRDSEESDNTDYQTVYARFRGSVAAPTAGLHFTDALFADLAAHNIDTAKITLHVGAGTFKPVKSANIGQHDMHTESFGISRDTLGWLVSQLESGLPIVAVGTTTVRTLESLPLLGSKLAEGDTSLHVTQWEAYTRHTRTLPALKAILDYMDCNNLETLHASTSIMIAPGFPWKITDVMVTNFHQPRSTLLLLVSSFLGGDSTWRRVYDEALAKDYRFLSYGDACLFFRPCDFNYTAPIPNLNCEL